MALSTGKTHAPFGGNPTSGTVSAEVRRFLYLLAAQRLMKQPRVQDYKQFRCVLQIALQFAKVSEVSY